MNAQVKQRHENIQMYLWALVFGILLVPFVRGLAAEPITVADDTFFSSGSKTVIGDIRVVIDGPPDKRELYAAMAKRLIRIKPGDPLDKSAVQASIDALKLSNRFSAVHVDSISTSKGETVTFTLNPHRFIEDIRIRGKYPLFERDILNQMTLYPGDPYTREDLSAQADSIIRRYQREGYVDPKVSIKAQQDTGDDHAVIIVDIDKGPHYVLGRLTLEGSRGLSPNALKRRMAVWRSALLPGIGRFSEYRLKKDMTPCWPTTAKKDLPTPCFPTALTIPAFHTRLT